MLREPQHDNFEEHTFMKVSRVAKELGIKKSDPKFGSLLLYN